MVVSQSTTSQTPSPVRCLVLTGARAQAPRELLAGLRRKGAQALVLPEPADVLVELARTGANALIVDSPRRVRSLPELLAAVRRYHPQVVCWKYEPDPAGQPQLRRIERGCSDEATKRPGDEEATENPKPEIRYPNLQSPETAPSPTSDFALRTSHLSSPSAIGNRQSAISSPPGPLLSREELDMLLGPDASQGESSTEAPR